MEIVEFIEELKKILEGNYLYASNMKFVINVLLRKLEGE